MLVVSGGIILPFVIPAQAGIGSLKIFFSVSG